MMGETPPSSAVIGFSSFGRFSRLRRAVPRHPARRRTPHDRVERRRGSGDVDVGDARMSGEVRADVAAAAHDPDEARLDERSERPLEHRQQGVLGGVQLEQRDAVVGQQFVQHVEHGDRRDVSGAEDEPDPAGCLRCELRQPGAAPYLVRGHSRLEPDLAGESGEQQTVDRAERKHVCAHSAAGRGIQSSRPGAGSRPSRASAGSGGTTSSEVTTP